MVRAVALVSALTCLNGCVARSRGGEAPAVAAEQAPVVAATNDGHGPSTAAPTSACESRNAEPALSASVPDCCRVEQKLRADLDHDGSDDCLLWTRCGPDEPSEQANGGLAYPEDRVVSITSRDGRTWQLYSNRDVTDSERFAALTLIRFGVGDERVVTRATGYGTGNAHIWAVVDVFQGALRRWLEPPRDARFTELLASGEQIGKQYGNGAEVEDGQIELAWLVYRPGDPNCCPTGCVIRARLSAGDRALHVEKVWRAGEH